MLQRKAFSRFLFLSILPLLFLMGSSAFAKITFSENVTGTINLDNDGRKILEEKTLQKAFLLKTLTTETQSLVDKLNPGDYLAGTGSILSNDIVLDSIDFVGIKSLIGNWQSGQYRIQFNDFSRARAQVPYNIFRSDALDLNYSITPGEKTIESNIWRIFFSSGSKVQTGTIEFTNMGLNIIFFDPNSGDPIQTLIFHKVQNNPDGHPKY